MENKSFEWNSYKIFYELRQVSGMTGVDICCYAQQGKNFSLPFGYHEYRYTEAEIEKGLKEKHKKILGGVLAYTDKHFMNNIRY